MHVFIDDIMQSNCYVIESGGHGIVIDPNESHELLPWIMKQRITKQEFTVDYILLTHEHCDHISGVNAILAQYSVPVVCSRACSDGIQDPHKNMSSIQEVYLHFRGIDHVKCNKIICKQADITYDDDLTFTWQQYTIQMHRIPGHTVGSSIIYLKDDVTKETIAFTGDYLIQGESVITRLQSGDTNGYITYSKQYLENLPVGLHVYPGHGSDYLLDQKGTWKDGLSITT